MTSLENDGTEDRRVAFIGQPSAGKSELAGCCGERCDGTVEEEVFELPGFVGMIHGGRTDLARRAKEIVRGEKSREDATTEALRRLEEGPTMPSFSPAAREEALKRIVAENEVVLRRLASNDGLICKCPAGSHTIEDVTIVGDTGTSLDSAL